MQSDSFEPSGYSNIRKIAEGGFGEVYFALKGETPVAIKRLKDEKSKDPQKRALFENEIEILKKLSHPNIPRFIDSFQSEKEFLLIMEYIDGLNLAALLKLLAIENSYPPPAFVFEVLLQLCSVLRYLHSYSENGCFRPVIHCDVKPKNILITRSAKVALVDFTVSTQKLNERKQIAGTFMYMSPGILMGEAPSEQSDVYALVATLYELLLLRPVVKEGGTINDVFGYLLSQGHIDRIRKMRIVKPLESLLLDGLAFHRDDRFLNARELEVAAMACMKELRINSNHEEIKSFLSRMPASFFQTENS
jgi:serine/threonine protein kinase